MAQDVTIAGASYEDVPGIEVPKTGGGTSSFFDVSDTTATAADVAEGKTFHLTSGAAAVGTASYAAAPENMGNAVTANAILFGRVDSTSTATVFTATVDGLDSLYDGATVMLRNGIVTSASGFTINVNNLGAKPVYNNLATGNDVTPTEPTRDTTIFNINYTMLFVYDSQLEGGAWVCYRGYDANTNTIGYQLRTNSGRRPASDTGYRYRIWLTSPDGAKWVPINTSSATNATSSRTLNTRAIDPFGPIAYNSTNGTCNSGSNLPAATMWRVYTLTIGYSYVKSLTAWDSVYLKCLPNTDGSAVMKDVVQALPTSKDGFIYILLGTAYSATGMELQAEHPVYWHDGTGIRLWTGAESGGGSTVTVTPSLTSGTQVGTISVDGTTSTLYAPTPPTVPSASTTAPLMDGTASYGSGTNYARANHVHPTDTSRQAKLVSGTNIKTINGNSLLGAGDLPIRELPVVTTADNGKVLMVVGGIWQVASLPLASDSAFGVVKVDGTTITSTNGIISTDGGGGTSSEVTITLTNPLHSGEFQNCHIFQSVSSDYYPDAEEVGVITSPTGNATVTVSKQYLRIEYHGMSVALGTATCTGGISLVTSYDDKIEVYEVTGDGTIVSDGVDYDD